MTFGNYVPKQAASVPESPLTLAPVRKIVFRDVSIKQIYYQLHNPEHSEQPCYDLNTLKPPQLLTDNLDSTEIFRVVEE